mmetsp:Transcript_19888/g.66225  ORF Transcript_19888/g.66225 Transcript_19888/m.66225 type:complete len:240 (+) Transcript_19888:158-877(+)
MEQRQGRVEDAGGEGREIHGRESRKGSQGADRERPAEGRPQRSRARTPWNSEGESARRREGGQRHRSALANGAMEEINSSGARAGRSTAGGEKSVQEDFRETLRSTCSWEARQRRYDAAPSHGRGRGGEGGQQTVRAGSGLHQHFSWQGREEETVAAARPERGWDHRHPAVPASVRCRPGCAPSPLLLLCHVLILHSSFPVPAHQQRCCFLLTFTLIFTLMFHCHFNRPIAIFACSAQH